MFRFHGQATISLVLGVSSVATWIAWLFVKEQRKRGQQTSYGSSTTEQIALIQRRIEEYRFRTLVETMDVLIGIAAADGSMEYVNQQWRSSTGLTMELSRGSGWVVALHPDDVDRTLGRWRQAREAGEPCDIEYRLKSTTEGGYRWYRCRIQPVRGWEGRIVQWFMVATDVHVYKETEETLQESRTWLEWILSGINDAIIAIDLEQRVIFMNGAAQTLTGWPGVEPIRRSIQEVLRIVDARTREAVEHPLHEVIRNGKGFKLSRHALLIARDGTEQAVEGAAVPLRDAMSLICGVLILVHPATLSPSRLESQSNLQELLRSYEELEQFAASVVQEMRGPLHRMDGFARLLERRYQGRCGQEADRLVGYIMEGAVQMDTLLQALNVHTQLNRRPGVLRPVNLSLVAQTVVADLVPSQWIRRGTVELEPLPIVVGDPVELRHLLRNLLSNALKFRSQAPPRVRIFAKQRAQEWIVGVEDNGIGIEADFLEKLFRPFQRVHAMTQDPGGVGLGLVICRRIADRHGGRLWAESKPGRGSTFYVSLPMAKMESPPSGPTVG